MEDKLLSTNPIAVPDVFHGLGHSLNAYPKLIVTQDYSFGDGCCACCDRENKYRINGGEDGEVPLFVAKEHSGCCTRMCCGPNHSFMLEIAPHDNRELPILTLERPGCNACFICSPKPCLPCCACCECCTDSVYIHRGRVSGDPGSVDQSTVVGVVQQPNLGGGCTPTLELKMPDGSGGFGVPVAYVEGPTCFGGCSELCCTNTFFVSREEGKGGDLGEIKHLRPTNCCQCCKELTSDADRYHVEFKQSASPEERAAMLSAVLLTDYMFFEMDKGMCALEGNCLCCTCCLCYCYGALCPINLCVPALCCAAKEEK